MKKDKKKKGIIDQLNAMAKEAEEIEAMNERLKRRRSVELERPKIIHLAEGDSGEPMGDVTARKLIEEIVELGHRVQPIEGKMLNDHYDEEHAREIVELLTKHGIKVVTVVDELPDGVPPKELFNTTLMNSKRWNPNAKIRLR